MNKSTTLVYTATTETTGGRDKGSARSSDGSLDLRFSTPGSARIGTNPEQLVAIAWSVSFASSVATVARDCGIDLSADARIRAEVDLSSDLDGYVISVRLALHLPGIGRDAAARLIEGARSTCPYTRATRGNVEIVFDLV